jgi:hypothetical protein
LFRLTFADDKLGQMYGLLISPGGTGRLVQSIRSKRSDQTNGCKIISRPFHGSEETTLPVTTSEFGKVPWLILIHQSSSSDRYTSRTSKAPSHIKSNLEQYTWGKAGRKLCQIRRGSSGFSSSCQRDVLPISS